MTTVDTLARFATAPLSEADEARAIFRLSLLDWLACIRRGIDEPVANITRAVALEEGGAGQAHIAGGGQVPARAAAMVNGTTSHALDYDDTHFAHIGHPSVAVIPAALAVAEREGATGAAFQDAALIGVEASVRIGVWLGRSHYQIGYHQTATAGAFGAALACARLMGLTELQIGHVLGLTATRAAGLKAQFGTMGKPYNAGLAAQTGGEAATLVAKGFESTPKAFDAFAKTHHGAQAALPTNWLFPQVSHKFHACCHGLHATLEALAEIEPQGEIDAIEIVTHPRWMSVCNQSAPTTGLGAKFSYTTVTAMAVLGHDTARPESYSDALMQDQQLQSLRTKVTVRENDSISETTARVTVHGAGGTVKKRHDLLAPQPLDLREARVRQKAASLLGRAEADRLWALVKENAAPNEIGAALG